MEIKKTFMYEGKAKTVYATENPEECVIEYRNTATAFNGEKREEIEGKAVLNCAITGILFRMLEQNGVPTHLLKVLDEKNLLVKKVRIVPLEVIVRNVAAGSFSKRYGVAEGTALQNVVTEFSYKNDELGDPLINDSHITALGLATQEEIDQIISMTLKINELLISFFGEAGLNLIDFKLEFGKTASGEIILADEISPDTCRLWDRKTGEKMDKDRFRRDMGHVIEGYQEVFKRISK